MSDQSNKQNRPPVPPPVQAQDVTQPVEATPDAEGEGTGDIRIQGTITDRMTPQQQAIQEQGPGTVGGVFVDQVYVSPEQWKEMGFGPEWVPDPIRDPGMYGRNENKIRELQNRYGAANVKVVTQDGKLPGAFLDTVYVGVKRECKEAEQRALDKAAEEHSRKFFSKGRAPASAAAGMVPLLEEGDEDNQQTLAERVEATRALIHGGVQIDGDGILERWPEGLDYTDILDLRGDKTEQLEGKFAAHGRTRQAADVERQRVAEYVERMGGGSSGSRRGGRSYSFPGSPTRRASG